MTELLSISALYTTCNAVRLLMYGPQMLAVMWDRCGAYAISLTTWGFWTLSHAVTAAYCHSIVSDALLTGMMRGNTVGCGMVVALTSLKRRQHAVEQRSSQAPRTVSGNDSGDSSFDWPSYLPQAR